MNGRVYDPGLGRFLSVDPVFQFPTNTQSLNPYTYVLNSPLSHTDPTGLCTDEEPCETQSSGGQTAGAEESDGKEGGDKPRQLNKTQSDPRSSHRARANAKFDQTGATAAGTPTVRNLANGTDTRQAAKKFDKLGKELADTIGAVSKRAEEMASQRVLYGHSACCEVPLATRRLRLRFCR